MGQQYGAEASAFSLYLCVLKLSQVCQEMADLGISILFSKGNNQKNKF